MSRPSPGRHLQLTAAGHAHADELLSPSQNSTSEKRLILFGICVQTQQKINYFDVNIATVL